MKKTTFILSIIVLLALFLRFFQLGSMPVGFHRDEAVFGYNAYSLLKTGKDINGASLPLHFESFIYSPSGYSYFSIPFVAFFGLNEFAVRFASAFFGVLTIPLTFYFVRELFKRYSYKENLALLSAFLLSILPWHINLSRTATENVLVVFFLTLGSLLFLHWIKNKKTIVLFFTFLAFGITLAIYQAPRAFLPFFVPLLLVLLWKEKLERKSFMHLGILYLVFIILPLFMVLSSPKLSARIKELNIWQHPEARLVLEEQIREDGTAGNNILITRMFHNKVTGYSSVFLQNYFKHFSYEFLFTDKGLPDRYRIPLSGIMYTIELPLFLSGVFFLLRKPTKESIFLLCWIILAPVGSALTYDDVPNLQRTLIFFPAISIVSAFGLYTLFSLLKQRQKVYYLSATFVTLLFLYQVALYFHQYFVHQRLHRPWFRQEGYKQLVARVNQVSDAYKSVVITNRETAPAIFFLFYSQYNPATFQNETKARLGEESDSVTFGKYIFTDQECPLREETNKVAGDTRTIITGKPGILYVNHGLCNDLTFETIKYGEIMRHDNTPVFSIHALTEHEKSTN